MSVYYLAVMMPDPMVVPVSFLSEEDLFSFARKVFPWREYKKSGGWWILWGVDCLDENCEGEMSHLAVL